MKLTVIILTFNEALHIERCIQNAQQVSRDILVVDSGSTDDTVALGERLGARVLHHAFTTHAAQMNWALTQLDADTDWVLRMDADEYMDQVLVEAIQEELPTTQVHGLYVQRRMIFQGRDIRYGLVYPVNILRLFRHGHGRCMDRWMDEHVEVTGATAVLKGTMYDHNLRPLTWWTTKHNRYASLEAVEQLNLKHRFLRSTGDAHAQERLGFSLKRWIKHQVYGRLPPGARALAYFLFRYVLALGFLDGKAGTAFHVLQGGWYRYLVDAKVAEVERYMRDHHCDIATAVEQVLDVRLS